MKIPFVGSSKTARSANASCERSVNVYLEMDNANPRAPVALYGMPGLVLRATLATAPHRGVITSDGLTFWVAGNKVYKLATDYTATELGTIGTSSGRVGLATNGAEVLIVDGVSGWIATSSALTQIVDVDFPSGVTVAACQDGFFIVAGDNSQRFYWNETPNTGADWNGLDFASVEGDPDDLVGIISDHREVWFVGSESTEVFVNTGSADQLFQRSGNGIMEQGTVSPWTVQPFDNSVVWLSKSKEGQGMVLKSQGGNPVRLSDHALEKAIAGYAVISDAYAFTFQMGGHWFYVLTFPSADKTWFYDAASSLWFEWSWRDPADNADHRHRSVCYAFNNGKHLVGDWETGKVYSLEAEVNTDNGDPIRRRRVTQSTRSAKEIFFANLILDIETGVGAGFDPQVMLRYSDDDGRTWSNEKFRGLGAEGQYGKVVRFAGPLGKSKRGKGRVWDLSLTDDAKFALFGADVDAQEGA